MQSEDSQVCDVLENKSWINPGSVRHILYVGLGVAVNSLQPRKPFALMQKSGADTEGLMEISLRDTRPTKNNNWGADQFCAPQVVKTRNLLLVQLPQSGTASLVIVQVTVALQATTL